MSDQHEDDWLQNAVTIHKRNEFIEKRTQALESLLRAARGSEDTEVRSIVSTFDALDEVVTKLGGKTFAKEVRRGRREPDFAE